MIPITILDYGVGNIHSLRKALETSGAEVHVSPDREVILNAAAVALPGVGAFGRVMEPLLEWKDDLASHLQQVPTLAVCVGMQILYAGSAENEDVTGLGIFADRVDRLSHDTLPHMGWNRLSETDPEIFAGISSDDFVYFVHTYAAGSETAGCAARCAYGTSFAAAARADRLWAFQFHPEKSGETGLRILGNFVEQNLSS